MAKYVTMQHIFFDYTESEERVIADAYDDFFFIVRMQTSNDACFKY